MGAGGLVRIHYQGGQDVRITYPLPLYETTDVKIRAIYNNIQVLYNGTLVTNTTINIWRGFGMGQLYVADPNDTPTTANVGPVSFFSLDNISASGTASVPSSGSVTSTSLTATTTTSFKPTSPAGTPTPGTAINGCERSPPKIACPSGKKLASNSYVQYGRWINTVCRHSSVSRRTPAISKFFAIPSRCVGQISCQLGNLNDEYEDVYSDVYKHFTAVPYCS